jgi:SNF2 family DNA or RNA helicase
MASSLRFHTEPWPHQVEALDFLFPRETGALYTTMGSGKSKVIVDLVVNRGFKITLLIAPKKVCRVWMPQFLVHAPNERITVLNISGIAGKEKAGIVQESVAECKSGQLVIVCNYDSVWREPFRKYLLNKLKIDAVICDESHRIKSPGSKVSKVLQLIGRRVRNRFIMSGTPLAQNPLDIYAQYRFLEPTIFGTNYGNFKDQYSNQIQVSGGFKILDKNNPYKNLDDLHNKMFSCAYWSNVEQSLPETQTIDVEFDMNPASQKHYKELQKEGALELKEGLVMAGNVLAVIGKLQQLASGYLPVMDDDGNQKIVEVDPSRQETIKELLEDISPDEPVVVFAKYTKDIKNIRRIVHELGRKSSEVSGKRDTLHNWDAGKTTVLVVQISAGAEGIDLTRARYCIYYSHTQSLGQYLQSRKRVHRPGQDRPVTYYRLVARMKSGKTIDQNILEALENNQSLVDAVMEGTKL